MTAHPIAPGHASLRRRLMALLLGVTATAWVITSVIGYQGARHEAEEILDAHLAQTAALLIAQPGGELEEIDTEHAPALHRYSTKVAFQVWEHGTRLRLHSANAPDTPLSKVRDGFSSTVYGGTEWRAFSAWDRRRETLVQVAERQDSRDEIAGALAWGLATSLMLVLPFLGAAVWLAIGEGLRPLHFLQKELARRGPAHLQPLPHNGVPAEVLPLVDELNRLFARIDALITRERRFTADAAHELRTPLAVLQLQAQVANTAAANDVRREALDGLIAGTARATRLVEQLLTLARLEASSATFEPAMAANCDLREIVRMEAATLAPQALERGIDIEFAGSEKVTVAGQPELLAILARNLIDNAVRYSPANGMVMLSVDAGEGGGPSFTVSNAGNALSEEERQRLGERFYRPAGTDAPGSGIGVSIVARIAQLHGGSVEFLPGPGGSGLRVHVKLPQREPAGGNPECASCS